MQGGHDALNRGEWDHPAMKIKMKSPCATLTLDDGTTVDVERIGKGRFTTAWRNCSNVYLQTHEDDNGKEILRNLSKMDRNPHIPDCQQLDWQDDNAPYRWYKMPLYHPLTAKSGRAWEDYKCLHQIQEDAWNALPWDKRSGPQTAYWMRGAVRELVDDANYLSDSIKDAVNQLLDECCNYGEYSIEIVKRNCAVDDAGNLILLDPVFDLEYVRAGH